MPFFGVLLECVIMLFMGCLQPMIFIYVPESSDDLSFQIMRGMTTHAHSDDSVYVLYVYIYIERERQSNPKNI